MSYRVEIAKQGRAVCQATQCKKENVKIDKGELRQGVMVMFQEHQTWKWRHWGCVTPEVIHNWNEKAGGDMELIDGYDELPADIQEKVRRALEQGHVDDDDWKGDLECNRYTGKKGQGMFVKTPKKKNADADQEDDVGATPSKKPSTKKRGRSKQDDGEEADEKPAKKPRGKKAAKADVQDNEPQPPPAKKARKSKKPADEGVNEPIEPKPAAKKATAKKTKATVADANEDEEKPSTARKTKTKKSAAKEAPIADEAKAEPVQVKQKSQKRKAKGKKGAHDDE